MKGHKQFDGWEKTETPVGEVLFLRGGSFDICVWKTDRDEETDGKLVHYPDCWGMSCHRQFGFSKALPDAKDERTAKLMALALVQKRCRQAALDAANLIRAVSDSWHEVDEKLPTLRQMPFGKPANIKCVNCGATPSLPLTQLCGPCTFGDPATAGGNW